jgi:tyrosine-protein kinase Etk/Wzc
MRRPRLQKSFYVDGDGGLLNLIIRSTEIEDAIKKKEVPMLDIITCGTIPSNLAEFFHTNRFIELLGAVSANYDITILDNPPL